MLAASIHLSRGTPYIYMGEEIGMVDPDYDSMADYVDVESINAYQMLLKEGKSEQEAFQIIQAKSRDNSRIPMQWDASENAGFTKGTPWLKAGKSYPQYEDETLLVLNNFYATEVEIDLPIDYQNGQILILNYEDVEVSEKILLKPYQTLAIYVK